MMSHEHLSADRARRYDKAIDPSMVQPRLLALAEQAATSAFAVPEMIDGLAKGLEEAATLMRAVPIQEGRLLEQGIALLAGSNPDLLALTENIRLPVTPAALQLVEMNNEAHYRRLTLDADTGGRKGYTPDMLVVHQSKRLAYVVDIKRTLGSYEATRIADLKNRMLASSLVVPDLLYKEHRRMMVDEVRAVIINGDGQKIDIDHGIWPLSHLDHLLELDGAGLAIEWMRKQFASAVERNWKAAVRQLADSYTRKRDGGGDRQSRAGVDFGLTAATLERGDPDAVRAASDPDTSGGSDDDSVSVLWPAAGFMDTELRCFQ
ncbi:hypothetical protein [Rhizobium sp. C1]|uniref:hypothetical protein n=1 Tax=Rhizobium sp. C1 TaxID=1349799 RepID=UPI001E29F501|nr:hypothetical protein [Rhizobium sp. C1]MCD2180416.1 hypothetical protein [Rhizobium sp. C1]